MGRIGAAIVAAIAAWSAFVAPGWAAGPTGSYEVSPFVGGYWFDGDADLESAAVFGARVGRWLTPEWEPEFSLEGLRTDGDDSGDGANFFQTHLDALYHFDLGNRFLPFLAAGVGLARYQGGDHGETEWDLLLNYGAGLKCLVTDRWALRLDLRQPITIGPPRYNLMVTLGLAYLWGRSEASAGPITGAAGPRPSPAGEEPGRAPEGGPVEAERRPPGAEGAVQPEPSLSGPSPKTGAFEPAAEKPVEGAGLAGQPLPGFQTVHFDFDEYAVTDQDRRLLDATAVKMKAEPAVRARIEGHCDERGTTEYNMALGERRAKAAFDYLRDQGIPASRLSTVSYGREQPADPGHNEEAWARNRRADFVRGR